MVAVAYREMVDALKEQWKRLWQEKLDDKVRAEGIAEKDYSDLFVDKGTVVFATRDFKPPDFAEVLRQHKLFGADRFVQPVPSVGGWGKFIKTTIVPRGQSRGRLRSRQDWVSAKKRQQSKKGGRGWLHA